MTANDQLNLGMRCIKYLLCAINSLFVLTGVMIVSVGTTIYAVYNDFSPFLHSSYASPATVLIVVGALIFIISFFGCCGALKESTCMVLVFAVSLSLVLILEFAAAISAYALQDTVKQSLEVNLMDTMHQYQTSPSAKASVDSLQYNLRCCGWHSFHDWENIKLNETYAYSTETFGFPRSCCKPTNIYNGPEDYECIKNGIGVYATGCYDRLALIVSRSALYIGTAALAITLVQLTGIMFACVLGRAIRRQKTERERRRWELRESLINGYQPNGKCDPLNPFSVGYMKPPIEATKSSVMS